MTHTHGGTDAPECTTCKTQYKPKHRKDMLPMCTVCQKRPQFDPGSPGLGGALCLVCYYDL